MDLQFKIQYCTVCFHFNGSWTKRSFVKKIFLENFVLSGRDDKHFCQNFQVVVFHGSISKHVHSFLVIIILKFKTTGVKRTINKLKTNVGIGTNHVKFRAGSN